jgi:hypothetical protein
VYCQLTCQKHSNKQTGGGPPETMVSDVSEKVMAIVPAQVTTDPLLNVYDSDGSFSFQNSGINLNGRCLSLKH